MQFNLFTWIRECVRQSVILGVSDAIETIGAPPGSEDITPHLKSMLEPRDAAALPGNTVNAAAAGGSRKRLGRSLKDLDMNAKAAVE
jgi:hypothetical protein